MSGDNNNGDDKNGPTPFNRKSVVAGILAQYDGDATKAVEGLAHDQYKLRGKLRRLKARVAELEDKLGDAELDKDAIVLAGEEATEHLALKELKVTSKQVKDLLAENDTLKATVARGVVEQGATKAARALGLKDAVLLDLLDSKKLELTFRKAKVKDDEGNEQEQENVPSIRPLGDEKGSWTPLMTAIEEGILKDYQRALVIEDDRAGAEEGEPQRTVPVIGGRPTGTGKSPKTRDVLGSGLAAFAAPGDTKAST